MITATYAYAFVLVAVATATPPSGLPDSQMLGFYHSVTDCEAALERVSKKVDTLTVKLKCWSQASGEANPQPGATVKIGK